MKEKWNWFHIFLNIIFYALCVILIFVLLYPHMSVSFRKKLYYPVFRGLNTEDMVIVKGKSDKLSVLGINNRISFSSSDFKVAEVQMSGKVYAHKVGRATITAKANHKVYKCRVRVIDINKKKMKIKIGKKASLDIKGMFGGVRWSSSNKRIVKVSAFGTVTGVGNGTAVVTGKIKGNKLECRITVLP